MAAGISIITMGLQVKVNSGLMLGGMLVSSDNMGMIAEHLHGSGTGSLPLASTEARPAVLDIYFSADVETDGPIPGPFSMLSFGLVLAGTFDGDTFSRPEDYAQSFYRELRPISDEFQIDALKINGLDRDRLFREGALPVPAMTEAAEWVSALSAAGRPVLVAYPLSFDWSFLYWYFIRFSKVGSPFNHSQCFDIKTAFAVKARIPIASAGRTKLMPNLRSNGIHTHNALDDAIEQAQVFANLFEWSGNHGEDY
ncbi:MAG: hypothetical protein ABSG51_14730 [Terracidiphilus sp.]|jgi:hypothetical protein